MSGYYTHLPASVRKSLGTVKKGHPEQDFHIRAATMLKWMLPPTAFHTTIGHGGGGERRGQALKRMNMVKGVPDYLIIWRGRPILLEFKAKNGRLSPEQKAVHQSITIAGGLVKTCRTEEEVVAFLETLQIPLRAKLPPAERAVLKARSLAG